MKYFNEILGSLSGVPSQPEKIKKTRKNTKVEAKNELVIQHNHLIEARYRLSLQEKRVILWLLTQIRSDDEDFKLHKLKISEFSKMVGLKADGQYRELQSITGSLIKRGLKIHEPEAQEIIQVSWLSAARYQINKGCVLLEFSPQLKPYLLQLKSHFTKLSISDIMELNSVYAIRFYELLKQYESIGQRKIDVKDLREYCGIAKDEYKRYNDFKKDILERAKREINEKTDIAIDYQEIKQSRKIVTIEWKIKKKSNSEEGQKLLNLRNELRSNLSLIESLIEYGFSRSIAKKLLQNNEEMVVRNALKAVDIQVARGKVKNPKAMLQTAIIEQWHPEVFREKQKPL